MNIASLHGHEYSALQYSFKTGISKTLYTFYFDITFSKIIFFVFWDSTTQKEILGRLRVTEKKTTTK